MVVCHGSWFIVACSFSAYPGCLHLYLSLHLLLEQSVGVTQQKSLGSSWISSEQASALYMNMALYSWPLTDALGWPDFPKKFFSQLFLWTFSCASAVVFCSRLLQVRSPYNAFEKCLLLFLPEWVPDSVEQRWARCLSSSAWPQTGLNRQTQFFLNKVCSGPSTLGPTLGRITAIFMSLW